MAKILIADDEKVVRDILVRFLTLSGYEVDTTDDGFETIDKIKTDAFDILIMDLKMPQLKGADILLELRKNKKEIPCLILTGAVDAEESEGLKRIGFPAGDILYKPIDLSSLLCKIKEKLSAG